MTTTAGQPDIPIPSDDPGDVPGERDASLDRLDALTGQWEMAATFGAGYFGPGTPAVTGRGGRTEFAWLDGRFFLTQRFTNDHPAAPSGIAIIGPAGAGTFTQHYYDSRGVARTYQMTFDDDGVWRLWRLHPGFSQRYTGRLAADGTTITGAWEASEDGTAWKHDFRLDYRKLD